MITYVTVSVRVLFPFGYVCACICGLMSGIHGQAQVWEHGHDRPVAGVVDSLREGHRRGKT